jgi:hypothetical protein
MRLCIATGGALCAIGLSLTPSFLNSASLPLAQLFTNHTEQALCSAKKGQSRELGIIPDRALVGASCADVEL